MVGRLEGGDDSPAGGVTLHALGRCPSKDPLHVATLANDLRVPAGELKSRRCVGEFHAAAVPIPGIRMRNGED